jgi:putative glutamine amidotransferase
VKIAVTLDSDLESRETNDYVRALRECGFLREQIEVLLPGDIPAADYDGLVLGGGADVDPARYGQPRCPEAGVTVDAVRDELDFSLLHAARRASIPVLGICRGLQVINVALGGTLIQDIGRQRPSTTRHVVKVPKNYLAHPITVAPASRLEMIAGSRTIEVNSRHHQGIDALSPRLRCSAEAPDGLPEAIETEDEPFLLAVQWHPENLYASAPSRALFGAFHRAVAGGSE